MSRWMLPWQLFKARGFKNDLYKEKGFVNFLTPEMALADIS